MNKEFIVRFSGGEYDDFYEYNSYVLSKSKDDLEYKLLECNGKFPNGSDFEDYQIYPLEEWKEQNKLEL